MSIVENNILFNLKVIFIFAQTKLLYRLFLKENKTMMFTFLYIFVDFLLNFYFKTLKKGNCQKHDKSCLKKNVCFVIKKNMIIFLFILFIIWMKTKRLKYNFCYQFKLFIYLLSEILLFFFYISIKLFINLLFFLRNKISNMLRNFDYAIWWYLKRSENVCFFLGFPKKKT